MSGWVNHEWRREMTEAEKAEARKPRPLFGPIGSGAIAEIGTLAEFAKADGGSQ